MARYQKPKANRHRGFVYLDDDAVTDSLSALEAGKIDEVIAKISKARESGFKGEGGADFSIAGKGVKAGAGGERSDSNSHQEELIRKRTRFSIFEAWQAILSEQQALGVFTGWGPNILEDVSPGDTVRFNATIAMQPLQVMFRLFLWYWEASKKPGSPFKLSGEEQKSTKETAQLMQFLFLNSTTSAGVSADDDMVFVHAQPTGDPGPEVLMQLNRRWAVLPLGSMNGVYSVIGQVERVLKTGENYPAVRITYDVPVTQLEETLLRESVSGFTEAAQGIGLDVDDKAAFVPGPAMIVKPIGIYR